MSNLLVAERRPTGTGQSPHHLEMEDHSPKLLRITGAPILSAWVHPLMLYQSGPSDNPRCTSPKSFARSASEVDITRGVFLDPGLAAPEVTRIDSLCAREAQSALRREETSVVYCEAHRPERFDALLNELDTKEGRLAQVNGTSAKLLRHMLYYDCRSQVSDGNLEPYLDYVEERLEFFFAVTGARYAQLALNVGTTGSLDLQLPGKAFHADSGVRLSILDYYPSIFTKSDNVEPVMADRMAMRLWQLEDSGNFDAARTLLRDWSYLRNARLIYQFRPFTTFLSIGDLREEKLRIGVPQPQKLPFYHAGMNSGLIPYERPRLIAIVQAYGELDLTHLTPGYSRRQPIPLASLSLSEESIGNRMGVPRRIWLTWESVRQVLELTKVGRETLCQLETAAISVELDSSEGTYHRCGVIQIEAANPEEAATKIIHECEHAIRYARGSSPSPSTMTKRQFVKAKLTEEVVACFLEYEHAIELFEAGHKLTCVPAHFDHFYGIFYASYSRAVSRKKSSEAAKETALTAVFEAVKKVIATGVSDTAGRELYPDYYARLWDEARSNRT